MRQAWKLIQAELLVRLRDKSFWLEVLILPLAVTAIMGMALGGVGRGQMPDVRVGIVGASDKDIAVDVLSHAFAAAGPYKTKVYPTVKEGRAALHSLKVDALVIPPAIDPATMGQASVLSATVEPAPDGPFRAILVSQITEATLRTVAAELGVRKAVAEVMTAEGRDPTPAWTLPTPIPVTARLDSVPVEHFDVLAAQFAGLAIFFGLFTAVRIMSTIFGPHRKGLALRLAALPTHPAVVALGYIGSVMLVTSIQTSLVFVLSRLAFGVHWGSMYLLVTATLLAAFASAAVALALATLPTGPSARALIGTLVVLVGSVLGGALVPIDDAGPALRAFAWLTPHYWVSTLFRDVARGLPASELFVQYGAVAVYGGIALVLAAVFLLRRRTSHA